MKEKEKLISIIEGLKKNPMFWMSLGSKELFHSNFLQYLSTLDPKSNFIDMLNGFLPEGKKLPKGIDYCLDRELEDFDICLYHMDGDKIVYDVVLENKVKSIPYKEQLTEYVNKTIKQGSPDCRFILLTLSKVFPDKGDPSINNWKQLGYSDLREGINSSFLRSGKLDARTSVYLEDYLSLIEQLEKLGEYLTPGPKQRLFDDTDKKMLEEIRFHDMYLKLRASWFALNLKNKLNNQGIPTNVVNKFNQCRYGYVNLNVDMNMGNGQIAAWICDGNQRDQKGNMAANTYEVVIQGNQYRHGINQQNINIPGVKDKARLNGLYDRLSTIQDNRPLDFLNFNSRNDVRPKKPGKHKKSPLLKTGPFDCYGEDYVYRYTIIDKTETIGNLLDRMYDDILKIWNGIPNLY